MLIDNRHRISVSEVPRGTKMERQEVGRKKNIRYVKFTVVNELRT